MRNRGGIQGVASSPAIVGAVTVLVVIVAVFLAYNANNGLPFVSTYDLHARVPNANALVKGNEVRIGGSRVGVIRAVRPVQNPETGAVSAELDLKLDKSAEPIPANSTMIIRPKSPLGLKYLQIVPGDSSRGLEAGETIPQSAARPEPVDIDQFFDMFDEKTRTAFQRNNAGFGNAFAGRGPQLNAAFARVSRPFIQETIVKGPPTLDAVTADLPALRPFFRDAGNFFTAFEPGARALGRTSPTIAAALKAGIPALNRSPVLFAQLTPTAEALLDFQAEPGVFNGLDLLIDTNEVLAPAIKYIAPAQTRCNYLSLVFRNLASAFSESNGSANWLATIAFEAPSGPNAESQPASAPANGPEPSNHLHYNPYPRTGQDGVCEAGNERYAAGKTVIGRSPKLWGTTTKNEEEG